MGRGSNGDEVAVSTVPDAATISPPPSFDKLRTGQASPASEEGAEQFDLMVLGAGPGGYSAAFRAADLGLKVVLVERYAALGGVCLNVGCIPSKALLHVAAVMDEVKHFDALGITFTPPTIDLGKLRTHKEKVVGKLTGGLAAMAKMRKVTVVQGDAEFANANHLSVNLPDGKVRVLSFKRAVIAAGSEAVELPFLPRDDPRVVTSTGALK